MKPFVFSKAIEFENEDFLAVNKPANLSCLHDRSVRSNLLEFAKRYTPNAQLCHRIDKETSGLVLVAKNNEAFKAINKLFEKRTISKTYAAVVHGRHFFENEKIDLWISTTSRGRARVSGKNAKEATTIVNTIEHFKTFSLLECKPRTGRLHQIRVHLKSFRAPIVGDSLYGDPIPYLADIKRNVNLGRGKDPKPLIQRTALHARRLEFELYGTSYSIEASYPKDIEVLIKLLRKYNS